MRSADFPYLPKDFIETAEGLIFAVVSYQPQEGKVGCFLRYIKTEAGWRKVKTDEANQLLSNSYPDYLFHSKLVDAQYHAVLPSDIVCHHKPEQRLQQLQNQHSHDEIEQKCISLIRFFQQHGFDMSCLGLTGSMLIQQQKATSDIDFAVYGRKAFQALRRVIERAIQSKQIDPLDFSLMQDNFARRDCDLSYDEFAWHEQRKFNKAAIQGTKFDIGMVCLPTELNDDSATSYKKLSHQTHQLAVVNADCAFDFPAIYHVEHPQIKAVYCFTPTYSGQAVTGEMIEVRGAVEVNLTTGEQRLVVGSTREAHGEYIKVITTPPS
jgi:hypothetical protein